MNISRRLKMNALLFACMVSIIGAVFLGAFTMQKRALSRALFADTVLKASYELNSISNRYLRYPEERPRDQWEQVYRSLAEELNRNQFRSGRPHQIIVRIRRNLDNMRMFFEDLVLNEPDSVLDGAALENRRSLAANLILKRSREVSVDAGRLVKLSNAEVADINRRTMIFIPIVALALSAATLWTSSRISRSITGPVSRLRRGVEAIGYGELSYRVGRISDDELGQLATAFDQMSEKLDVITVSRDELSREVEERKRIEAELREHQQRLKNLLTDLERSNKDLEQFAYVASHDLQEPLRMVSSYVQLLAKKYGGQLDEQAQKYINFAVDGSERMQKLIEGLLSYSRLSRGKTDFKAVDMNAAFEAAASNLAAAFRETGASLTKSELPVVPGDETQIIQLFQNLLANAVKFRRPDTRPAIRVNASESQASWVFSVADNGIGILPEYYAKIFLIFQRLHTRREYPGTGIGLALCKKIVERHHGRIWVESKADSGTTFFFTIPREV